MTNLQGLLTTKRGCKINQENQFIDFRLITQSRKNHVLSCFVSNLEGNRATGFLLCLQRT
ncbi:MAG TPA: hypothetical protein DIT05_07000 [Morganella sp. (in: Bacteria)]|nr:hypothetical protein [Morganella sp. (in: enterobacteria)]